MVLVKEERGWTAFFCTDANATVEQILEAVADRAAIEQTFHDVKEVHGTGQQQVRNYCKYNDLPFEMRKDHLDRVVRSYFTAISGA